MIGVRPAVWPGLRVLVAVGVVLLLGHGSVRAGVGTVLPAPAQEAPVEITNPLCPVLEGEPVDPEIHTEFDGRSVFLCCQKCRRLFDSDPAAYVGNLPAGFFAEPSAEATNGADDHDRDEEHDHADHGGHASGRMAAVVARLGRLHPMVVHFPIALLLAAGLAHVLGARSRSESLIFAARYCLWIGALGAVAAAALGWADAIGVAESYSGSRRELLEYHRWTGSLTAVVSVLALVACEKSSRAEDAGPRGLFRWSLFTSMALVAVTGHLGASLIFGWDYLFR